MASDPQVRSEERFAAFISYAHVDSKAAEWLHRNLEQYRIAKLVTANRQRRLGRIFLDRSELASSSDLSSSITQALQRSDALIVVCSPAAASSRWVNQEIACFLEGSRPERIFCYIVAGDPGGGESVDPFPPALFVNSEEARFEPLAADIRQGKDSRRDASLKIIAGLLEVSFDTLKRRDQVRGQRRLALFATVSSTLLLFMTFLAAAAWISRQQAVQRYETANRTATFMRNMFEQASPELSGGRKTTVLEMLDRASDDTLNSEELRKEPEIRADLLASLAEVYAKIGDYGRSNHLIEAAYLPTTNDPDRVLSLASISAENAMLVADYPTARAKIDKALALPSSGTAVDTSVRSRLLTNSGQVAMAEGNGVRAQADFAYARTKSLSASPPDHDAATTALAAAALSDVDSGNLVRAEEKLRQVIAERRQEGRPRHPNVLTAYNTLGVLAVKRGDAISAEKSFRATLKLQKEVLGADHLDPAVTQGNLGRALVEQRRFKDAAKELIQARQKIVGAAGGSYDALANIDDSLGLAQAELGQYGVALASFDRGLEIAVAQGMPKEIELLADRAELMCSTDRSEEGMKSNASARAALRKFDLSEPWRWARLDQVEAGCWIARNDLKRAAPLVRQSAQKVLERWGKQSPFGKRALNQLAKIAGS